MKTLLLTLAAALALAAAPALAHDHGAHQSDSTAAKASNTTPEQMHKHCAAMMDAKTAADAKHDHSAEKGQHEHTAKGSSEAEMKAMHDKCAAMMAHHKAPAAPAIK